MDMYDATFIQSHYSIVYNILPFRGPENKDDEASEEAGNESVNWRNVGQDKLRMCIAHGVHTLQKRGVTELFVDPFLDAEIARRWMEMPANLFGPETFAHAIEEALGEAMKSSAGDASLNIEVHDKSWIEQQGMGGVLGVAKGSAQSPYFVEVNYLGDPSRPNDHIALVGKGVTFDSGGISIKPSAGMSDMRGDMGGAAVMASVLSGIIQLQSPINIRAYLPLVENMPDGKATRPGDVIRMANGCSVQVENTDAEGRLILADALHYAQSRNPLFIMDAATLTGAISIALGDQYTGIFCNRAVQRCLVTDIWPVLVSADKPATNPPVTPATIIGSLNYCGRVKCDPFWHMPSLYSKQLKECSATADLANIVSGPYARLAGSGSASAFLQYFVNSRIPYIHLDIAGVMKTVGDDPTMRKGMTGRPTRALIHFFDRLARHKFGREEVGGGMKAAAAAAATSTDM
ncbi:hypothetical protein Aperf_G00000122990 [Anoplocephala perfoliata]